jgi:lipopolysaccharide export system permease protein
MILHRYFARRFALTFLAVFALFFLLMAFLDLIEQSRRFSDEAAGFDQILALALLSVPQALYRILPLIVVIATVAMFLSLARNSELAVTRAAGRSALSALGAPVLTAVAIGALGVIVWNPIVAATSREYETRTAAITGETLARALAQDGLWLRQGSADGQAVIRADRANLDGTQLTAVSVLRFDAGGAPLERIEAASARLTEDAWLLQDAKVWPLTPGINPETAATLLDSVTIPSTLTPDQIRDSFGTPSSIAIWDLPGFITRLQEAGFTARRHQVFFQMELALPAMLVAMVLIGAAFTLRPQRGGRTGVMLLTAILLAFGVYVLRNLAQVLGDNGEIPPALAAWAPPLAAIGMALGLLLHLEDG